LAAPITPVVHTYPATVDATDRATDETRHYRQWGGRAFLRAYVAFVSVSLLGVIATDYTAGSVSVGGDIFAVLMLVIVVLHVEFVATKTGLTETADGYVDRGCFGLRRRVSKQDTVRFEAVGVGMWARVELVKKDGSRMLIRGVYQGRSGARRGRRVVWEGGVTRDFVGLLNERQDAWRASHDHS